MNIILKLLIFFIGFLFLVNKALANDDCPRFNKINKERTKEVFGFKIYDQFPTMYENFAKALYSAKKIHPEEMGFVFDNKVFYIEKQRLEIMLLKFPKDPNKHEYIYDQRNSINFMKADSQVPEKKLICHYQLVERSTYYKDPHMSSEFTIYQK